jgi:hypothetical protein
VRRRRIALHSKFGRRLAERGYVVFALMISAQTTENRNSVARRAHLVGFTPVGIRDQ